MVANIIYGNLELIGSKPIGILALVIEGDSQQIDRALKYIIGKGAIVEEIEVDCDRVYKKILA